MIILILLSVMFLVIGLYAVSKDVAGGAFICGVFFVFFAVFAILEYVDPYKQGQIDALKGDLQYKMEIRYDSTLTPVDTVFTEL